MLNPDNSYRLFAFKTKKGIFTLIGSSLEFDTFKNLSTFEYFDYPRSSIKKWLKQGLIEPVPEATSLIWHHALNKRL